MAYASTTIGAIIGDINETYFLPAIQRPYVWSQAQITSLFDSILKSYPISSFMFWAITDETRHELKFYNFIQHYRNDTANQSSEPSCPSPIMILDGQQRMTSLLIGLKGTYSERPKGARKSSLTNWPEKHLYIDLLKDPSPYAAEEGEDEHGVSYGLAFHQKRPPSTNHHHWFKVGDILYQRDITSLERLVQKVTSEMHPGVSQWDIELAISTLRQLHRVIWQDETINFYTEYDQSADRVLDIFVRANDGGVKLSKADLLMSMITSRWKSGTAREDINDFATHINNNLRLHNKITRDFILKTCLVLLDYDVKYSVSNFKSDSINAIETNWDNIKKAIETTFRFLNAFGIGGGNLSSLNATLPLIYYIYRSRDYSFSGTTEFERLNGMRMHRWLLNSLLVGAFAGQSDQTIATTRATIKDHLRNSRNFPAKQLFSALAKGGRISQVDDRTIDEILDLRYPNPRTFIALSLIHPDNRWADQPYDVDHIIPQADAQLNILRGQNLTEDKIQHIMQAVNRLGNLQLLGTDENIEKGCMPFRSWLTSRSADFLERNAIPDREDLYHISHLPHFVKERENLIRSRILASTHIRDDS